MELLNWLTEPFDYGFMVNATLVTLAAAVVCGVLSCWLVLMGWALMGDAVSHAVLPGVALSFIFGVPFAIGALVFAMLAVFLIGGLRDSSRLKSDAATGVVFTALFALGIVIISRTPSQVDLTHILFGNVLGTGPAELAQVLILGAITLAILLIKRKDLVLLAFDRVHAHALGLNASALHALLLGLLALTVVASLQAMGTILVVAMLIIPGATAVLLTRSFSKMLLISVFLGLASTIVGVYASYYFDLATGASVVLAQAVFFAIVYLFSPTGGIIPQWRLRRAHAV